VKVGINVFFLKSIVNQNHLKDELLLPAFMNCEKDCKKKWGGFFKSHLTIMFLPFVYVDKFTT